jgi:hypothetical protein
MFTADLEAMAETIYHHLATMFTEVFMGVDANTTFSAPALELLISKSSKYTRTKTENAEQNECVDDQQPGTEQSPKNSKGKQREIRFK